MDYDYLIKYEYRTLALGDDEKHGANGKMVKGKLTAKCVSPGMAR